MNAIRRISSVLLIFLACLVGGQNAAANNKPVVLSTKPAHGAADVNRDLRTIEIRFSRPMREACGGSSSNWPGGISGCQWSADKTTLTFSRGLPDQLLAPGSQVIITLNAPPLHMIYQDVDGNALDTFTLSFKVGTGDVAKIEPCCGFNWPYYLYVPFQPRTPLVLLVEPNNSGGISDDAGWHEQMALQTILNRTFLADRLGVPLLVPAFPRPATHSSVYTHALDRNTLLTQLPGLERIDLQLLAMVDHARQELARRGMTTDSRIWLLGFSASGSFVGRFTMLHPDRVRAASVGAGGFGPIVPVAEWKGKVLNYPVGIADLHQLVGTPFDRTSFQRVAMQVYVGDEDTNIVPWFFPNLDPEAALADELFGGPECFRRWPGYELLYQTVSSLAQFVIFPGLSHRWPSWDYITEFFERYRRDPAPPPLPKPLLYSLYFPHIACFDVWRTEVCFFYTKEGAPVKGTLEAFDASGSLLSALPVEIPPLGRKEILVNSTFERPERIAYLIFRSDSGFVNGYNRFYEPLNRVAIPVDKPSKQGWFPKNEPGGGWTGIALLNTETFPCEVELAALDSAGQKVMSAGITIQPGEKLVKLANEIFAGDLSKVSHFSYRSTGRMIGFSVNGTADGQMMDGMSVIREEYLR